MFEKKLDFFSAIRKDSKKVEYWGCEVHKKQAVKHPMHYYENFSRVALKYQLMFSTFSKCHNFIYLCFIFHELFKRSSDVDT